MLTIAHQSTLSTPRRGWATLTSFALQATLVTAVLLIPLLQPSLLPQLDLTPHLAPVFLPHVQAPPAQQSSSPHSSPLRDIHPFTVPREVPSHTALGPDPNPASEIDAPCAQCVAALGPISTVPTGMTILSLAPAPPPIVARPPRVSRMMDGYLLHRVQPDYPVLARQARVHGLVELAALISRQGTIENLQVVSGHPMLVKAALDAVKQWRYRPYVLNGEPIEVDTKITVTFVLGGN